MSEKNMTENDYRKIVELLPIGLDHYKLSTAYMMYNLEQFNWNYTKTAKSLGFSLRGLRNRLIKQGIKRPKKEAKND